MCNDRHIKPAESLLRLTKYSIANEPFNRQIGDIIKASTASVPPPRPRLGATLREERRRRGVSLYQAEQVCRVRWDYLQAIEQEQWEYVPRAHRQAAIRAYAAYLGVPLRHPRPSRIPLASVVAPAVAVMVMLVVAVIYFL
jgi:hypothetical protein